ncbi:MAG: hypothetical protein E6772_13775 [Dysgonomonas sp.]|nr:hypothetical protein [Dysgonomonas sp.]
MEKTQNELSYSNWIYEFRSVLPFLGHRNWILIVDKAFPLQSAAGMRYMDTKQELLPTIKDVLTEVNENAPHLKPIIYSDLELNYITEDMIEGIGDFRRNLDNMLQEYPIQTLLHEEVFSRLDDASKLFEVVVLKTETTIPYTSIFVELDCGYWTDDKEEQLRQNMKKD